MARRASAGLTFVHRRGAEWLGVWSWPPSAVVSLKFDALARSTTSQLGGVADARADSSKPTPHKGSSASVKLKSNCEGHFTVRFTVLVAFASASKRQQAAFYVPF